jgi:Xaa-Pro aminopeptidase
MGHIVEGAGVGAKHIRKIDPASRPNGGGSLGSFDELGPGELALSEWTALGLQLPNLENLRQYRLDRVRAQLRAQDCAGAILADPLNVRYATDCTNMQLWCAHNAVRYVFVATEGPVVLFDFHGGGHLSEKLPLIDETRAGTACYYFGSGGRYREHAKKWAAELVDLVRLHGGGNKRVAIDRVNPESLDALRAHGIDVINGEMVMEHARAVKSADEIHALRCSVASCEAAIDGMRAVMAPGMRETELWSHLHAGNIKRGGEWLETRLLSSGPRTNPWFRECSARVIEAGDIVAFDTDLIGPYGYCSDISRTWVCGVDRADDDQRRLYDLAVEHIEYNIELLKPGLGFREFVENAHQLPNAMAGNTYSVLLHGVGLCDEYPAVYYPDDWESSGYDGQFLENMMVCVEAYVGEKGGKEGVKLEQQVLITADGPDVICRSLEEDVFK